MMESDETHIEDGEVDICFNRSKYSTCVHIASTEMGGGRCEGVAGGRSLGLGRLVEDSICPRAGRAGFVLTTAICDVL